MLNSFLLKNKKGFSLIEVLVGVAVFVLFAMGIYGGIQYVFKIVYNSRLRIIETSVLNEQIEIIRNMPFSDIGIVNGSPSGDLARTVTTTRNGIDFTITRTIRNIDDPFDGTIGGTPNDTAPADYKQVEVEIICNHCAQKNPQSLSTYIGPKYLEGDPTHGALFIEVFDANAEPVADATVHIVSTSTNPSIDMSDVTDNDGMLRIVDLGAGMNTYHITVSKSGHTTDGTIPPSVANPHPVKQPASVAAQSVTEISFSIDKVSSIDLNTVNSTCAPLGSVPINIIGTKLIGTEPDVFRVNQNVTTDGGGHHLFSNLDWDVYGLLATNYDVIGTIPLIPINLLPDMNQPVQMMLGANTANSLLVHVRDSVTGLALSSSTVRVVGSGYSKTKSTGVGFINQTDWSGGDGQINFSDETKYWYDDGKIENNNPAGDIKLKKVGKNYVSDAYLESSIFDLGVASNFVNLVWEPLSQPAETGVGSLRIQIATANTSTPAIWNYLGPDGTSATYYSASDTVVNTIHNGNRYLRYKIFLSTEDYSFTPTLSDLSVTYVTTCTPPGQAYFGGLVNQEYTIEVSHSGYQTSSQTVTVSGDMIVGVDLVAS